MRKLLLFSVPFAAGILLCQYILPEIWRTWAALAVLACGGIGAMLLKGRRRLAAGIAASGLVAGILWVSGYAALYLSPAEALAGTEDVVTLELMDYPEEAGHGGRCVVRVLDRGLRGKAMYYGGYDLLDLEPGNRITTTAKFYSAVNLAGEKRTSFTSQGIFLRLYGKGEALVEPGGAGSLRYLPQRVAWSLRQTAERIYGEPARGFLTALLTGERDGLDVQSSMDLTESGLIHITAVSGLHCGILIGCLGLLVFRRQKLTAFLGYPVLLAYMVMVGCTPSVVRSCVMVGFFLLAPLVGREQDTPTSLAGALLVILAANPFAAASVSLQLSFASVTGLLVAAPKIYAVLNARRPSMGRTLGLVWNFAVGTVASSLGVMVLTAPLTAVYFGTLTLISVLSNLLVLWMMPVLFTAALAVTAGCALWPGFDAAAFLPEAMARYVLRTAGIMTEIPGHCIHFTGPAVTLWLLLSYTLLAVCAVSRDRRRKYLFAAVIAAVCLAAAKALPVMALRGGELTAAAVDVGQGSATLLHSDGITALVDCGTLGTGTGPGAAVANTMEAYGWDGLDYVILTHYHEDHAGGLAELLARVNIGMFLLPQLLGSEDQAALQEEVLALAERYGVPVRYVESVESLELGTARLQVYPPLSVGGVNEEGLTALCSAGRFDILVTGDMGADTERKLVETYELPDIEVLVAGHHGSKNSTSVELLETVTPEVGIISVGAGNTFGHPAQEAMDRMREAGMTLYRTDLQGNILIQVHGD